MSVRDGRSGALELGLVNNASDAAFATVEQQFHDLLKRAWPGRPLRLHLFTLPGVPRHDGGANSPARRCAGLRELMDMRLDGLIVTGAEPQTAELADEFYWDSLVDLLDWAERGQLPMILSCLATHAAVLHRDGIRRVPLPQKCFGMFHQIAVTKHPLLHGASCRFDVPHSRSAALRESDLVARGYRVLTRSEQCGVDMFVGPGASRSLYLQGHPEYGPRTLLGEYRRDVGRFLKGECVSWPALPMGCLDAVTAAPIEALRNRTRALSDLSVMTELSGLLAAAAPRGTGVAPAMVFGNWLGQLRPEVSH